MCCIGPGPGGEDVVRSAARLAAQLGVDWTAVYVETPTLQRLTARERERILKTVKLAKDRCADRDPCGGFAVELIDKTRRVYKTVEGARRPHAFPHPMVMGARHGAALRRARAGHRFDRVGRGAAQPATHREQGMETEIDPRRSLKRTRYLWAGLACLATTYRHTIAALFRSRQYRGAVPADSGLVAVKWGRGPGARRVRQRGDLRFLSCRRDSPSQ